MQKNNFAGMTFPGLNQALHDGFSISIYRLKAGGMNVLMLEADDDNQNKTQKRKGTLEASHTNFVLALNSADAVYNRTDGPFCDNYNGPITSEKVFDSYLDWWIYHDGCIEFITQSSKISAKLICHDKESFYDVFFSLKDKLEDTLIALEDWLFLQHTGRKLPEYLPHGETVYNYFFWKLLKAQTTNKPEVD
jgi:hypothetical protein